MKYVNDGLIAYASELYYPIRLKPPGENSLDSLRKNGVNHIELRMVDLNPLTKAGLDVRDLKTVKIAIPNGEALSVADAGLEIISWMKDFYKDFGTEVQEILEFEEEKFLYPEKRYAWQIRKEYGEGFAKKGLKLSINRTK
ncbi:MAG: hypothetical protein MJ087_05795 [Lachnospiraceae bacterium]|nr:hypothetical protein [Lachnospiraceae bacterium]